MRNPKSGKYSMDCDVCGRPRNLYQKPKYPTCRTCRSDYEHSQDLNKKQFCNKCNKKLSYKNKDMLCRNCRPKLSPKGCKSNLSLKRKVNGIPYYTDEEVNKFLMDLDLNWTRKSREQFLIDMLRILNYADSRLVGMENMQGSVITQLSFFVRELYLECNKKSIVTENDI